MVINSYFISYLSLNYQKTEINEGKSLEGYSLLQMPFISY